MGAVRGKHILYFALQPPPEAAARVGALVDGFRRTHRLAAKPTPLQRLDVPLNWVGDFKRPPGPVIEKALEAAAAVSARPFMVEFNRAGTWPSDNAEKPLVLSGGEGVTGVSRLYSILHRALVKPGMVPRRESGITPHMTLLLDRAEVPETVVEPVSWRVEEFVLIHAVHGEGRHEAVGRFPLSG